MNWWSEWPGNTFVYFCGRKPTFVDGILTPLLESKYFLFWWVCCYFRLSFVIEFSFWTRQGRFSHVCRLDNNAGIVFTARCTVRGIAIACRLSVRLSVCDVGGSGTHSWKSWKLLHGQLAQHFALRSPKGHPLTARGKWGNFGETRGGVGKNGVLEHKSGNISCRGKVTMEGL